MATLQELSDALRRLKSQNTDAIILQGRNAFVQAALDGDEFRLEAVADQFLDKPLTATQLNTLHSLGYHKPEPNHWQNVPAQPDEAAHTLATTLADVYAEPLDDAEVIDV